LLNSIFQIMNKYNIDKQQALEIGNSINNNQLIIKYNYVPINIEDEPEILKFNKSFDWIIDIENYTNMTMLHLHAWEPMNYLVLAYHYSGKSEYLKKCNELINSWYIHSLDANHKYLYYTHCVADRALVLAYLKYVDSSCISNELIDSLIKTHIEYLSNEKNYVDYNHGSMLDRSLLVLCVLMNDKALFKFSLERFKKNIENTFTKNMICKENSFTYSLFNLELIVSAQKLLLETINETLIEDFDLMMNRALNFLDIVRKPDGSLPLYGDGELITSEKLNNSILRTYYPDHSLFSPPTIDEELKTYYFKAESYIIIKNNYFYLFVRPGDIIKNHKHADDLSINLYMGEDVLIDTGIFNYEKGEYRNYLKSPAAHNTIELNYENYNYLTSNNKDIYIDSITENEDLIHIILINNSYTFANITRNIYILKNQKSIFIADFIDSPIKVISTQIFNLSNHFIEHIDVNIQNNSIYVNNKFQVKNFSDSNMSFTISEKNLLSEKFQKITKIPKIEFSNLKYFTNQFTYIGHISESVFLEKFKEKNNISYLVLNNKKIAIPFAVNKKKIKIGKYINVYKDSAYHIIEIYHQMYANQEYAIYIYDNNNNKIATLWYQSHHSFKYKFSKTGKYRIRCFLKNKTTGEKFEFSMYKYIKTTIQ